LLYAARHYLIHCNRIHIKYRFSIISLKHKRCIGGIGRKSGEKNRVECCVGGIGRKVVEEALGERAVKRIVLMIFWRNSSIERSDQWVVCNMKG